MNEEKNEQEQPKPFPFGEHQVMVAQLVKPAADVSAQCSEAALHRFTMAAGAAVNALEVLDIFKKEAVQPVTPKDFIVLLQKLGDLEFHLEALRQATGITRERVLIGNIAKCQARFPEGKYTDEAMFAKRDAKAPIVPPEIPAAGAEA